MPDPTLMFCAGATKAGTGWLYEYLSAHPECHFRSIKELHYFDALHRGTVAKEVKKHEGRQAVLAKKLAASRGPAAVDLARRLTDRTDWLHVLGSGEEDKAAYLGYLTRHLNGQRVIGDVTPAYGLLPEERMRDLAALMPDVRFVFLLRDPVSRLWSHVRMMAARRDPAGHLDEGRAGRILLRTFKGKESQIEMRSDYATIVSRLRRAAGGRLVVTYFEELFDGTAVRSICDHLSISYRTPAKDAVVHPGQPLAMTREQWDAARDWLQPQYDFVRRDMGVMPRSWGKR